LAFRNNFPTLAVRHYFTVVVVMRAPSYFRPRLLNKQRLYNYSVTFLSRAVCSVGHESVGV